MRLPSKLPAETTNVRCFGGLADRPRPKGRVSIERVPSDLLYSIRIPDIRPALGGCIFYFSVLFTLFAACISVDDVFGTDRKPITKFVRLHSPWQRGIAPNSSFEISVEGTRLNIRGEVVDTNVVAPIAGDAVLDNAIDGCILFAWSRSPLAMEFEGLEILSNGQFKTFRKEPSKNEFESTSHLKPEIRVTKTINGFRFECEFYIKTDPTDSVNNEPLYISLTQIDSARNGTAPRWYCSSIPADLLPKRFSASSFASLESFPSEKQDGLLTAESASRSFRIAELQLRNKWNQYASQPRVLSLAQKWYDEITSFPDAERFLERTRDGDRLQTTDLGNERTQKRLTDARSETMNRMLGQSWSLHLRRSEGISTCLPLSITTSTSTSDETQTESLVMWRESERLQIALLQNGEGVYWGSASWPIEDAKSSERVWGITLVSDGSTNGVGYELYANSKPLDMIAHNASNLQLRTSSPSLSKMPSKLAFGEWDIKTTNTDLQIDLYNTKLTPIEILSLDPTAMLLSWSELTQEQREAWRNHYVFCIDPEGRYFLESLKHYTSSQAELLRRSRKPAKK